jgi:hypothetical protein
MVRDNRIKFYTFSSTDLTGDATTGVINAFTDNPLNGRIQGVYYEAGNWDATGSIVLSVSGAGAISTILNMTSGTATGHHLNEDWVVYPRATTVSTNGITISGTNGYDEFAEIPIWSNLRLQTGTVGTGSIASGLTVIYI